MQKTMNGRYFDRLADHLNKKGVLYFALFVCSFMLMAKPFLGPVNRTIIKLFLVTYIFQAILVIGSSYILYVVRICLVAFMCFEHTCRLLLPPVPFTFNGNFIVEVPTLGYRFRPGSVLEYSTKVLGTDTIYHVYYSADEYGRRIVSTRYLPAGDTIVRNKPRYHALFLGCSYTFGAGLDDTSTFPFIFSVRNPHYSAYNYGFSGYGPHQMPLLFKDGVDIINNTSVNEDTGICVYTYIQDHLNRVYGGSNYLSYGNKTPDLYIENGKAVYKSRNKLQNAFSIILSNSYAGKYLNIKMTYPRKDEFYRRFASIINYTAQEYYHVKPHGKFYVSIFPGEKDTTWLSYLESNISVLKVPSPSDLFENEKYVIRGDSHPSYQLNKYYAEELTDLLR